MVFMACGTLIAYINSKAFGVDTIQTGAGF
jgi:hypothetical protein